ncbi:MAG: alpha/beta hydrolase [Planctomyces sp.]|nr:alpha/beta hydrolase [Planctomyces sp.]
MADIAKSSPNSPPIRRKRIIALRIVRAVVIGYLLVIVLMWSLQRMLLYKPRTGADLRIETHEKVRDLYPTVRDLKLRTSDGETLGAWLLASSDSTASSDSVAASEGSTDRESAGGRRLVLYFHGNKGDRSSRYGWYQMFHRLDVDVLAIDYRGYGDSTGSPTETGIVTDALTAWQYATQELGYQPENILIMGVSLGGGVAVQLASRLNSADNIPAGLVVVASFSSVTDVAADRYPFLPVRWLVTDQFESHVRIKDVVCPQLILHGDQDQDIPLRFGRKLYEASVAADHPVDRKWVVLKGTGHNDLLQVAAPTIETELQQFLTSLQSANAQ